MGGRARALVSRPLLGSLARPARDRPRARDAALGEHARCAPGPAGVCARGEGRIPCESRLEDTYEDVVIRGELCGGHRAGAGERGVAADAGGLAARDEEGGALEMVEAAIVEPPREEVHRGKRRCKLRASSARWRRTLSVRAGLTRREVFSHKGVTSRSPSQCGLTLIYWTIYQAAACALGRPRTSRRSRIISTTACMYIYLGRLVAQRARGSIGICSLRIRPHKAH